MILAVLPDPIIVVSLQIPGCAAQISNMVALTTKGTFKFNVAVIYFPAVIYAFLALSHNTVSVIEQVNSMVNILSVVCRLSKLDETIGQSTNLVSYLLYGLK